MTSIPLAEELLLLAYDDQTGKATGSRIGLDLGMAAAVLVDLALAGRVAYADGFLKVIDPTPTGEAIADAVRELTLDAHDLTLLAPLSRIFVPGALTSVSVQDMCCIRFWRP